MRKYPAENWKKLGAWIADARMQGTPEMRDTKSWARLVGRSTRALGGLERGEPQGRRTIELVADALGLEAWFLFALLADPDLDQSQLSEAGVRELKDEYVRGGGAPRDQRSVALGLARYTDAELVGEVGRRLERLRSGASADPEEADWPEDEHVSEEGSTRETDPARPVRGR